MPSIYDLKPKFQALLRPSVRTLQSIGVTANQVTVAAAILSICNGMLIVAFPSRWWPLALMPVVLLIRMGLNAIDGMLAREFGQKSRLGAILNELGDVVSDVGLYLPIALVPGVNPHLLVVFVLLGAIVEFSGVTAVQVGSPRRYDGPMGKSDRAFWMGLLATLLALNWISSFWCAVMIGILIVLSIVTVWNRSRRALDSIQDQANTDSDSQRLETNMTTQIADPIFTAADNLSSSSPDTRQSEESSFVASDGQVIFYRFWRPTGNGSRSVLLFHRGHEHSARWQDFVETSDLDEYWFFAWDARGHGRTEGTRGDAESFSRMVLDAEEFSQHLAAKFGLSVSEMGVVGQSVGAVLAATWVHDFAPPIRAMVLATPALRIKLYVPLAIPALRVLRRIRPSSFIKSYVKPGMLTHDKQQAEQYANDPLISPQISVKILLDLHDTSTRLVDDAAAISTPTLMFVSDKDFVVRRGVQERFFQGLSSTTKQLTVLRDFYHSTFWEKDRAKVIRQTCDFLNEQFDRNPVRPTSSELASASQVKYETLTQPAGPIKRAWFATQRIGLNTVGRLSRGVSIGWQSGFDSGQSLDHVYRNRAEGTAIIGRLIDRGYLDAVGWKGIRQRKIHMECLLDEAIEEACQQFDQVRILDIAAGPGRYVQETIQRNESRPISAVLCDRDPGGLAEGRALAESLGIRDRTDFVQSDAFDPDAIMRAAGGKPVQVVVVSGLYELFPDNQPIKRSLTGIADVLADGGWLLYTDQPWHPQQEMIARVLPNRDGDPWVMRCRSQAEMDALVREAGLSRRRLFIDRWGIFSVALARKEM